MTDKILQEIKSLEAKAEKIIAEANRDKDISVHKAKKNSTKLLVTEEERISKELEKWYSTERKKIEKEKEKIRAKADKEIKKLEESASKNVENAVKIVINEFEMMFK